MKKNEFLELIKDMEDEVDIDETILSQGFAKPITDMEGLKQLLASNGEIKGYYQSALDSGIGKGVATFRENFTKDELPKLIDEAIKAKSNEGKTPLEIKLEEEISKREAMEKQMKMKDLESKYKDTLSEKGLDTRLMKFILSENEEDITKNIEFFNEIISSNTNLKVNERLNESSYKPKNNKDLNNNKTMTKDELINKGYKFMQEFAKENPDEYTTIMSN